jgi:hypothetical protein
VRQQREQEKEGREESPSERANPKEVFFELARTLSDKVVTIKEEAPRREREPVSF